MQALARMSGSFFFASGVTCLLFWLMQVLIVVEARLSEDIDPIPALEFVHVLRIEKTKTKRSLLPPARPEPLPAPPTSGIQKGPDEGTTLSVPEPFGQEGARGEDDPARGFAVADGEAIPILRVAPVFPEQALARGVVGRVLVEFDVSEVGTVENARIVAYEPSSVFNEAALRAVRQWRYNPKVVNGRTVRQAGVRISIPFRRDETSSGGH